MRPLKMLWMDVETTGLDPVKNTLHQVAGIITINGTIQEEFDLKMKPIAGAVIEEEALAVSNLETKDVIARRLTSESAYRKFNKILCKYVDKWDKADKMVIGAYNAPFDAQFVNQWYNKHDNKYFFGLCHGGAYFDPLQIALLVEIAEGKRLFIPDRKLPTIAKILGVPLENAHDALADITATKEIGRILFRRLLQNRG